MSTKNILNEKIGDTLPPATICTGKWVFEIDDCGVSKKAAGTKGWFNLTPVKPAETDDPDLLVDPAELEEYIGDDRLEDKTVFHSFQFPDRQYECKKFLEAIGVDVSELQWRHLNEVAGFKFQCVVAHDPNEKDPARPWVRLSAFQPFDDDEEDEDEEAA